MAHAIYIYGVINSNERKKFDSKEKAMPADVYTIPYQEIACAVSDYPKDNFDYGIKEKVAKELVMHQTIIERIMMEHTIIPVKFGTLLKNTDEVRKALEKGYFEFKERLKEIENRIELDVVAMWDDLQSVIRTIGDEDERIRKYKQEIAKKPPQDIFQERIKIGGMIKDVMDKRREEMQREMIEFLKAEVKIGAFKKHETMDDKMILNCAFFLERNRESEFDHALQKLDEMHNERLNFRCVGPLPPYSFYTYEIKKADFEAIENAWKLLNLSSEANASDIKAAYRRLAQEKHPDRFPDDMEAQKLFEKIQDAYDTLLDYCQSEKKSLRKEDVKNTFLIGIFDIGYLQ